MLKFTEGCNYLALQDKEFVPKLWCYTKFPSFLYARVYFLSEISAAIWKCVHISHVNVCGSRTSMYMPYIVYHFGRRADFQTFLVLASLAYLHRMQKNLVTLNAETLFISDKATSFNLTLTHPCHPYGHAATTGNIDMNGWNAGIEMKKRIHPDDLMEVGYDVMGGGALH